MLPAKMNDVLYYIQVIDLAGGVRGAERVPEPVNCRIAVTRAGAENWKWSSDLLKQIISAPGASAGIFNDRYQWIKE